MSNLGLQMQYTIIRLKCPMLQVPAVRFFKNIVYFHYQCIYIIASSVQTGGPIVANLRKCSKEYKGANVEQSSEPDFIGACWSSPLAGL